MSQHDVVNALEGTKKLLSALDISQRLNVSIGSIQTNLYSLFKFGEVFRFQGFNSKGNRCYLYKLKKESRK